MKRIRRFYAVCVTTIVTCASVLCGIAPAHAVDPDMELVFRITSIARNVNIPLQNFTGTVNWGDQTTNTSLSHTYPDPGAGNHQDYTVTIDGSATGLGDLNIPRWREGTTALISVNHWNGLGLTSLFYAFYDCDNLAHLPTALPTGVTSLAYMFLRSGSNVAEVAQWNTSSITNMQSVFDSATNFNQDLTGWNTSNVTNMFAMFAGATSFNGNVSNWNTSQVQTMYYMFNQASNFNQDLSDWNFNSLLNAGSMVNSSNISPTNLSKLLQALSTINLNYSPFEATGRQYYSSVQPAVDTLVNTKGWTITATSIPTTTPTITTPPVATSVPAGQTLSNAVLSGGLASAPGTFAFTAPNTVITAGSNTVQVRFSPTDTYAYTTTTFNITVTGTTPSPSPSPSAPQSTQTSASSLAATGTNIAAPLGLIGALVGIGAMLIWTRQRREYS